MGRALLAAIVVAVVPSVSAASPGQMPIIGGTPAQTGEFPTVVVVEITLGAGTAICTGTLIHPLWVMTAAHCVQAAALGLGSQAQATAAIKVRFDTLDAFTGGMLVTPATTVPHPGFSLGALGDDDVGLIRLSTRVDRIVSPINRVASAAPIGVNVTFVGYGETGTGSAGHEYVLADRTSSACASFGESDTNLLCFDQTDGRGQCHGDSGGPTFAMIGGVSHVVGITSFGDQNCQFFGAETRVDAELAFLEQTIGFDELRCQHDGLCTTGCTTGLTRDEDCPLCTGDGDCAGGEVCDAGGTCVPEPYSPGGLGTTCVDATECATGECVDDGTGPRCTSDCVNGDDCPSGFLCRATDTELGVCWPGESGGGCTATGDGNGALLFLATLGLLGIRRRRVRSRPASRPSPSGSRA